MSPFFSVCACRILKIRSCLRIPVAFSTSRSFAIFKSCGILISCRARMSSVSPCSIASCSCSCSSAVVSGSPSGGEGGSSVCTSDPPFEPFLLGMCSLLASRDCPADLPPQLLDSFPRLRRHGPHRPVLRLDGPARLDPLGRRESVPLRGNRDRGDSRVLEIVPDLFVRLGVRHPGVDQSQSEHHAAALEELVS